MEGNASRRFLAFDLGDVVYAVEVERVEVVLEMVPITRVPRAPAHLRGVINYRGTVIPVADLRVRFGEGLTDTTAAASIVVLGLPQGSDEVTIGILADGVREVIDLEVERIKPAPGWGNRELDRMVQGVYEREGSFIVILDIEKAFESVEAA